MTLIQRGCRSVILLVVCLLCALAPFGCTCSDLPPSPKDVIVCGTRTSKPFTAPAGTSEPQTAAVGSLPGTFSVTSSGEASYVLPLVTVPSRAGGLGVGPTLALRYDSAGDDGVLGVGFALEGTSAITRCPSNLAQDGEIREVRYDGADKLCLDGKRLVPVGKAKGGGVEYRTFPDAQIKIVGHFPEEKEEPSGGLPPNALSFEAHLPSGLILEYGTSDSSKPLAKGGAPRAWLVSKARDGRGNAMTYAYCFADAEGYTAEYALDEIRYTSFEGTPSLAPSRAVQFVYGTKDPADVRTRYAGGMALQSSLRLDAIQMLGPEDALVRSYRMTYALSPTTQRTLLTQVEECASDGVCKPPTRFQFTSSAAGFKKIPTTISTPTSAKASPMLFDLDGDGLDDLVVPDMDKALSTPTNPITAWRVARNQGKSTSPAYLAAAALAFSQEWPTVADASGPADPALLQPELGTVLDYNDDGRRDVFLHDVYGSTPNWLVLLAQPDHTFKVHDTGIRRPFPLGASPKPPTLTSEGASVHLADLDGDGVPDLIQCQDHSEADTVDPSAPAWTVHLWRPAEDAAPAGFDPTGASLDPLAGFRCDTELYTLDVNADGKVDLLVQSQVTIDGTMYPASTYRALSRRHDGSWEVVNTELPIVNPGGRVVFLDVNGDGLPDAVESGFSDQLLRTYLNTGPTFAALPVNSLASPGLGDQDLYFDLAAPLDFNGDGRQDLLVPVPIGILPSPSDAVVSWAILQATGAHEEATFTVVDPHLPFEAELGNAITLADPHGPRIGDVNGDGAQDVLLPLRGVFNVFENLAPDQDLLVAVSDGMNAHDPTDPGFVPNVSVSYGHLTDASITNGTPAGDPALESALYLAHADPANGCAYPRSCAVGPRRVVRSYALNNGADGVRHFGVRYRDGRYHRLGHGFLGFAERIVTDLDTGAGTADFYDNLTFRDADGLKVFPFAGQVTHTWRWQPGLLSQPKPDQIELSFTDLTRTVVPTNENKTYFTLLTERRERRVQGVYAPSSDPAKTVEAYVQQIAASGGATVLRDSVAKVTDFDLFGNVRAEDLSTSGVDLTLHVDRTFKNDTTRWVLGQLETQKECSAAAGLSECRTLTRTTTIYGEVDTDTLGSDDGNPDTVLHVVYTRDVFGNVVGITADDAYGHHRSQSTPYDAEGLFPEKYVNAAGHTTLLQFDAGLGVLTQVIDPHQRVTERKHDGFGRLGLETRPDGTETSVTLARTKDGGPNHNGWRVTQRTTTTGGADDTVEVDSRGRPIRWLWYGPEPPRGAGAPPRLMQQITYDARGEHVARRSVPVSEGTPESELRFDVYEQDAAGREVLHATPWGAGVHTAYEGLRVEVTDPLGHRTVTEHDPLERPVTITDAAQGITRYSYGPFGAPYTVTDPGGALTRMTRDAYGRVWKLEDPDRGTTILVHDSFGELISSTDALGRKTTLEYDGLGRRTSRLDQHGAESLLTSWVWDTAPNGIGKLHSLQSPDGQKTHTYNDRGQLETITLAVVGQSEPLQAKFDYALDRVKTLTYPTPAGAPPFIVAPDYDPHGYVLAVRDSATNFPYWRLTDVDSAGRFREEVFGNEVVTARSYFADRQRLKSLVTQSRAAVVQNLAYGYNARRELVSRTDALQPYHPTERFRFDPLERLTCATFSVVEDPSAPCALSYDYKPDGNLSFKSDVGTLFYDDPAHPHAVTRAGSDSFGYDDVGNQTTRPGGATVSYTPFDLPKAITQGTSTVTFGYDGDERRIRKTTLDQETIYFGELYEQVTDALSGMAEHRYYVSSPERVVAVVTRGGAEPGMRYLHVDHLGSVDALTNEDGAVVEKRSYDPFGQRRNPVWGEPTPTSFASRTTLGFTGHESDDELGLVNMKGRIYDPKIGRFLTPDPIVAAPLFGQSWNPYTYVLNSPLRYVDPSGFSEDEADGGTEASSPGLTMGPDGVLCCVTATPPSVESPPEVDLHYSPRVQSPPEAAQVGAADSPIDVSVTGSASGHVPQPVTPEPEDWTQHRTVQSEGGFLAGLTLGFVPFGAVGQQVLDAANVLPHGTPEARWGLAVGQIAGGVVTVVSGFTGEVLGGFASVTGIGAAVGVPVIVVSTGLVVGGTGNIAAGIRGLMTTGSGSTGPQGTAPAAGKTSKLNMGQQGKHIPGHPNYTTGRSVLRADPAKLAERAGTGTPVNNVQRGQPGFRERLDFGEVIGDYVKDGIATPTTRGIIHHGKEGIHIVPSAP